MTMNQTQRRYVCKRIDEITEAKLDKLRFGKNQVRKDPTSAEIKKVLGNKLPLADLTFSFYASSYLPMPDGKPPITVSISKISGVTHDKLQQLALSKIPPKDEEAPTKMEKIREEASLLKDEVMLGDDAVKVTSMLAEFEAKEF